MPKPRSFSLETATQRRRLAVRKKAFAVLVSPGISLLYRRNEGAGSWSVRAALGGHEWVKRIAVADDLEPANGREVLDYWRAVDAARALARRQPGDGVAAADCRPVTVGDAVDAYERDLVARGGDVRNAARVRGHVSSALKVKPVALLGTADMTRWRDDMVASGLARATVNRTAKALRAALSLAAKRDRRIVNKQVWQDDLEALPDATEARNVILNDATVARIVESAHAHDHALGLLVQVLAETGSRPSQLVRLTVADLDAKALRLLVPRSGKGNARKRSGKMHERTPVPISRGLAVMLATEARGRSPHEPLLLRKGAAWGFGRNDKYRDGVRAVVRSIGRDPDEVTLYSLRHSALCRLLLAGVPTHLVAQIGDTSEAVIRRHYAKLLTHHADEVVRKGLLQLPVARRVA